MLLSCLIWIAGWLWNQCGGNRPNLELISGTQSSLVFLQRTQSPSRLVTVFLGTLWSSIKEVKTPFMFDRKHGLSLHAMQGNRASSRGEGKSHGVSQAAAGT